MSLIALLLCLAASEFRYITTTESGTDVSIDFSTIKLISKSDIWGFVFAETANKKSNIQTCYFRPHSGDYLIYDNRYQLQESQIQNAKWYKIPSESVLYQMIDQVVDVIGGNISEYPLDSVLSEPAYGSYLKLLNGWIFVGDKFIRTPQFLDNGVVRVWVSDNANSGVYSKEKFGNFMTVSRVFLVEHALKNDVLRICDGIDYGFSGDVIKSDNECGEWMRPAPNTFLEALRDYTIKQSELNERRKKTKRKSK